MKDFFEYINGCEVVEYHEGTAKGKFLYFILSYVPTFLMFVVMCVTFVKAYLMLRHEVDYTSVLLQCIALGVLILIMEAMARIEKDRKIAELHECCIFRYTDSVTDADMYWINELYNLQAYGADGAWIATAKKRGRIA